MNSRPITLHVAIQRFFTTKAKGFSDQSILVGGEECCNKKARGLLELFRSV